MSQNAIDWDIELDLDDAVAEPVPAMKKPVQPVQESQDTQRQQSQTCQPATGSFLYVDIETIPDWDRKHLFGLPPIPDVAPVILEPELMLPEEFITQTLGEITSWFSKNNPCDSWLDAVERAENESKKTRKGLIDAIAKCRDSRNAGENMAIAQAKKMSLTPEMCQIVAIGLAVDDSVPQSLIVGVDGVTEKSILETFWALAARCEQIVGFNILGFDLPAIFMRSILLGVPASKMIDIGRYSKQVIDLYVRRFGSGFSSESADVKTSKGLKALCRQMGISVPADGCDGSQVQQMYRENPVLLGQYVASDVVVSRKIHNLYSGYFC